MSAPEVGVDSGRASFGPAEFPCERAAPRATSAFTRPLGAELALEAQGPSYVAAPLSVAKTLRLLSSTAIARTLSLGRPSLCVRVVNEGRLGSNRLAPAAVALHTMSRIALPILVGATAMSRTSLLARPGAGASPARHTVQVFDDGT